MDLQRRLFMNLLKILYLYTSALIVIRDLIMIYCYIFSINTCLYIVDGFTDVNDIWDQ